MSSYDALAASYDELMADVEYRRRADALARQFRRSPIPVETVLDLACGTGTIACLLAARGYRVIGSGRVGGDADPGGPEGGGAGAAAAVPAPVHAGPAAGRAGGRRRLHAGRPELSHPARRICGRRCGGCTAGSGPAGSSSLT